MNKIPGYQKALVDWNETGENSKLKISKANIKKETVLLEKAKACYRDADQPLPADFVRAVIMALCKIRDPESKEKSNASNAVSNAATSELRKRRADPSKPLTGSEQAKLKKIDSSNKKSSAKVSELRKKNNDPTKPLTGPEQVKMDKFKVHLNKGNADKKAIRDEKRTLVGRIIQRNTDTAHGNSHWLPIDGRALILANLTLSVLIMSFSDERNANKIMYRLRSLFHLSNTSPEGMQMVKDKEVCKKALVPATWLEKGTIQGRPLLIDGIPHLKDVDDENMSDKVWASPGFIQCLSFYYRPHGRYYKMVPGALVYAYCILDTNDRFDSFEQHTYHGQVGAGCALLCRAKADKFIEPDACIEITIGVGYSFKTATFRLIRNNGDMDTVLKFP